VPRKLKGSEIAYPGRGTRTMRASCRHLLLAAFVCTLAAFGVTASQAEGGFAQTPRRPNIVFILADDLDKASTNKTARLKKYIAQKGATFPNAFVSEPICAPSRATILRGQYPHNHLVHRNSPPLGGFATFHNLGRERSTVATWLNRKANYRTAFIGAKYLNGYGETDRYRTYVPPGWDEWYATRPHHTYNRNGTIRRYPAGTHQDDFISGLARNFIERRKGKSTPFFMHISVHAPHDPAIPADRYRDRFRGERVPRTPSFNERDVSDKPRWVRHRSRLTSADIKTIDRHYRNRLRTMLSVGDMVEKVVRALREANKLDNTYIVFASDNGYFQGQHRLDHGKNGAYEEAIKVPLMVRGPHVPAGIKKDKLVVNNDLAPTFASWAGVQPPSFVDGRSFASLIDGNPATSPSRWRTGFEVSFWQNSDGGGTPGYRALRTERYLYVEYESGERELYDLAKDPYELSNIYETAAPTLVAELGAQLAALKDCSGDGCRKAENGGG
jgi:N-acetylglucosamine-6-sulfatase